MARKFPLEVAEAFALGAELGLGDDALELGEPATPARLAQVAASLGRLPAVVREALALHDGVRAGGSALLAASGDLAMAQLSLHGTLDSHLDEEEGRTRWPRGDVRAIPRERLFAVAITAEGDPVVLDLGQRTRQGTVPVYRIAHDQAGRIEAQAASLGAWLAQAFLDAAGRRRAPKLPASPSVRVAETSAALVKKACPRLRGAAGQVAPPAAPRRALRLVRERSLGSPAWRMASLPMAAVGHPDGRHLLVGGTDGRIHEFELASGRTRRIFWGEDAALSLAVTPGGERVLAAQESALEVFDGRSGERVALRRGLEEASAWSGHRRQVCALPGGKQALVTNGRQILGIDLKSGRNAFVLGRHGANVVSLDVEPGGQRALSCDADDVGKLWDLGRRKELASFEEASAGAFLGGGEVLLSSFRGLVAHGPGGARVLSRGSGCGLLLPSPDRGHLLAPGVGKLHVVDAGSGKVRTWPEHAKHATYYALLAGGRRVVSTDEALLLLELREKGAPRRVGGPDEPKTSIYSIACLGKGRLALGAIERVVIADPDREKVLRVLEAGGRVDDVVLCGGELVWPDDWRSARIGDPLGRSRPLVKEGSELVTGLAALAEGELAVALQSELRLVDRRGRTRAQLQGHTRSISHLAASPDGTRLVSVDEGCAIAWDARSRQVLNRKLAGGPMLLRAAFAPDGERVALGGGGCELRVVEFPRGKVLARTELDVGALAWLPSGVLAVAAQDGTVRVLDAGLRELAAIDEREAGDPCETVAVDGAGRLLVGTATGRLHVYRVEG